MNEMSLDLERALSDLGNRLHYPPVPDLSLAVAAHLRAHPRPERRRPAGFRLLLRFRFARRAAVIPILAALAILGSVLAASPAARSAVASWFHIAGVRIESGTLPPGPLGHNLGLGQRVSASEAQSRVDFPILIPTLRGLGKPDENYAGTVPVNAVSLLYRARKHFPRASTTGAGLLITESRGRNFIGKTIATRTTIESVDIHNDPAVFISGSPHFVYLINTQGKPQKDTIRLAGNVLLWQHGAITVRIEGRITDQQAFNIALSMRPQQ